MNQAVDPDELTAEERLEEVTEILARGCVRLLQRPLLVGRLEEEEEPEDSAECP